MDAEEFGPSLCAAFARVPDVGSRQGWCYPLPALQTLATAAMFAGALSVHAIAQWGWLQPEAVRRAGGRPAHPVRPGSASTLKGSASRAGYLTACQAISTLADSMALPFGVSLFGVSLYCST
jgi:hypothetical protein